VNTFTNYILRWSEVLSGAFMRVMAMVFLVLLILPLSEPAHPQIPHPSIVDSGNGFLEICNHVDDDYSDKYSGDMFTCWAWIKGLVDGTYASDKTPTKRKGGSSLNPIWARG
jgi:hypothetical protein